MLVLLEFRSDSGLQEEGYFFVGNLEPFKSSPLLSFKSQCSRFLYQVRDDGRVISAVYEMKHLTGAFRFWNWDLWARRYCLKQNQTGTEGEKQRQTVNWHPLKSCISTVLSLARLNFDLWKYLPKVNITRIPGICISQFPSTRHQRCIFPLVGLLFHQNKLEKLSELTHLC